MRDPASRSARITGPDLMPVPTAGRSAAPRQAASYAYSAAGGPEERAAQHARNAAAAARDGYELADTAAARWEDDVGGLGVARPGLRALLDHIESGAASFTRLYVRDLSRFGRFGDLRELLTLVHRFERGVVVVFEAWHPCRGGAAQCDAGAPPLDAVRLILDLPDSGYRPAAGTDEASC